MAKRFIFILSFVMIFSFLAQAQSGAENNAQKDSQKAPPTESFADLFKQGAQFYVAKEYTKSRDAFAKAVQLSPHNATALTNLALVEFQLGKKPLAIGLLRKALAFDPELNTAQAGLKFALSQLEVKEIPHQIETYESIHAKLLSPVPMPVYLFLTALLLFSCSWILLSYLGQRRLALHEEKALPPLPIIGILLSFGFLLSLTLLSLKIYDSSIPRATIIEDKVSLQTAPGDNQVSILDLHGGMEVILKDSNQGWSQVTYPGSLTGWVKSSSLLVTSAP